MVHEPIYLDLSSSDEDEEDHNRGRNVPTGSTALLYLAKVFHMDVDDDDVRIIDKPASNGRVKRDKARVFRGALDDDDCCILETDPGAADAAPDVVSSLNTDELVMTGEKGPVACRDFPHARYLCVQFPFKSTLHAKFCAQCHCYVCDSLAPCSLWGEGNSPNDHCHASEEPRWKSLRKLAKYGAVTSLVAATTGAPDPTGETRLVQTTLLQTLPAITPSPAVDPGVPRLATTVKRDPLVIQLKGKGRGTVSQAEHLGVKNARTLGVRRKAYARKSAPSPQGSTSPAPSGRIEPPPLTTPNPNPSPNFRLPGGVLPTTHPKPPSITTPNPNPNFRPPGGVLPTTHPKPPSITTPNPNPNFRLPGGVLPTTHPKPPSITPDFRLGTETTPPHPHPNPNFRLGRAVPSTHPRSTRSLNRAGGGAVAASPPHQGHAMSQPIVQELPQATNSALRVSAASYIPLPPPVTNDILQAPEAPSVISVIPDRRYVSASPLRSDVSIDPLPEDHTSSQPHRGSDFVGTRTAEGQNASSSSHGLLSHGGTVDILAAPIEGWDMDAAADFDSLGSPEHVPSSLNDVIQQMAADDALWEPPPFPGWQ